MSIVVSYEHAPELQFEAIVFTDDDSGECWQIQNDIPPTEDGYGVSTGTGAPIHHAIVDWRLRDDVLEFALTPRAAKLFGGSGLLTFTPEPAEGTLADIAEQLTRIIGGRAERGESTPSKA